MRVTMWEVRTSTPRWRSWSSALRDKFFGISRQNARAAFDQQDAALLRVDIAELVGHGVARDFGQSSGKFDAGGAASDDDKLQGDPLGRRYGALAARLLPLGQFESQQHTAADFERVFNRLQTGRKRLPFLVAKVGVGGPGGDDQIVEIERLLLRDDFLLLQIEIDHFFK